MQNASNSVIRRGEILKQDGLITGSFGGVAQIPAQNIGMRHRSIVPVETLSQAPTESDTASHSSYYLVGSSSNPANKSSAGSSSRFRVPLQPGMSPDNLKPHQINIQRRQQISDFLDRFQGKTTTMQKDGHLGVVERTAHPIEKPGHPYAEDSVKNDSTAQKSVRQDINNIGKNQINLNGQKISKNVPVANLNQTSEQQDTITSTRPIQFHRRNVSEIVVLQQSSGGLQPPKAQTSPEKRSTPVRREELSRQFEKLKNTSNAKNQISGSEVLATIPTNRQDDIILELDQLQSKPNLDKSAAHSRQQPYAQTLATPVIRLPIQKNRNVVNQSFDNFDKQQSYPGSPGSSIQPFGALNSSDRNIPSIDNFSHVNVQLLTSNNQQMPKIKAQFHSYQQNSQNKLPKAIAAQMKIPAGIDQTLQAFQNQPFSSEQNYRQGLSPSNQVLLSPTVQSGKKVRANSISNVKLDSSINQNSPLQGTPESFYQRMSAQYALSSIVPSTAVDQSNYASLRAEKNIHTPKSYSVAKKPPSQSSDNSLHFSGIGSSIIMRKTEYYNPTNAPIVSNKRLFSKIGGLGPANVGSDDWVRAKERQDRISNYQSQRQSQNFGSEYKYPQRRDDPLLQSIIDS